MKYTVHAGHAPQGKLGHGAVGYCDESDVARSIKNSVISWLNIDGNLVVDCTYEKAGLQAVIVSAIKKKINAEQNVTANISIHLNANKKRSKDNKTTGCECWVYTGDNTATNLGNSILRRLSALGFTNRSVKSTTSLGVLKGIKNGGINILVEVFFCDDEDDFLLYNKLGTDKIGQAIAEGIVGHSISTATVHYANQNGKYIYTDKLFGKLDMSPVFNPSYYANTNKDLLKAYGSNNAKLFEHFYTHGMKEGRKACADFDVQVYKERYSDLKAVYGQDLPKYYMHFCKFGKAEGRKGI